MMGALASKDLTIAYRSGVLVALVVALSAMMAAASVLTAERVRAFERERAAATAVDREVWDAQGDRNPHSAAHFSRYAFKPMTTLAAFDPGVADYAGTALWMEAHFQNPAIFRRAEDSSEGGLFASVTPAWILQTAAPLLVFMLMFSWVAGERETGALRLSLAQGARWNDILFGKLAASAAALAGMIASAAVVAFIILSTVTGEATPLHDARARLVGLAFSYSAYLAAMAMVAIGVSALFTRPRHALIALIVFWCVGIVLAPRLASDAALALHPEPDAATLVAELKAASDAYYQDDAYREAQEAKVLAAYGVTRKEDLPIDFGAYSLQSSEEHAHPLFEAFYSRLDAIHDRQEGVLAAVSLLSPTIAMATLSSGLSGADRLHHQDFALDAEMHRRRIVKQLNDDMMHNAASASYAYKANETLWRAIDDFTWSPPTLVDSADRYAGSALIILAYLGGAFFFAQWAVRRAAKRSAE